MECDSGNILLKIMDTLYKQLLIGLIRMIVDIEWEDDAIFTLPSQLILFKMCNLIYKLHEFRQHLVFS